MFDSMLMAEGQWGFWVLFEHVSFFSPKGLLSVCLPKIWFVNLSSLHKCGLHCLFLPVTPLMTVMAAVIVIVTGSSL